MDCICCEGVGCEECDHTGTRYRQSWTGTDGTVIFVSGSGAFDPELQPAFEKLAAAAFKRIDETREGQS